MKTYDEGYTLLELIVVLMLLMIITISISFVFIYSSNTTARIHTRQELEENARIAMEFLITHIRLANGLELKVDRNNTLDTLRLYETSDIRNSRITTFKYVREQNRNRITFGGRANISSTEVTQELARYIEDIKIIIDEENKLLHIEIVTEKTINNSNIYLDEPVILRKTLDIRYKNLIR